MSPLDIDLGERPGLSGSTRGGARRHSLAGILVRWFLVGFVSIALGVFLGARGPHETGMIIGGLCTIVAVVSLSVYLIRAILRLFLG